MLGPYAEPNPIPRAYRGPCGPGQWGQPYVTPCPTCNKYHAAYALFPPACQYPGDRHTMFVDGRPA